jgi:multicomponent Na+:H+ antiporter subunit E
MRHRLAVDRKFLRNLIWMLRYAATLVSEAGKSTFVVMRMVFSPKPFIEPRLVFFRTKLSSNAARVVLAHSITVPPGTITVNLEDGWYCIHCLNPELEKGLYDNVFTKKLMQLQ